MGTPQIPTVDSDTKLFPPVVLATLRSSVASTLAVTTATTDAQVTAWLSSALPGMVYRIVGSMSTTAGFDVPDGVTLEGYGASIAGANASTAHIVRLGNNSALLGVRIVGNKANRTAGNGVEISGKSGAYVRDVMISNSPNVGIEVANSSKYTISHCVVTGAVKQGISIVTSNDGTVTGNVVDSCQHGIQFWGGDATSGGSIAVRRISIANNRVSNVTGGIWGSLAGNVSVTGNTVYNVSDVGIDFEACQDCSASGNTVQDAAHACMSVFYGSQGITFSGNTMSNSISGGNGFKAFTAATSSQIVVTGNTIRAQNPIISDSGALSDSEFLNNEITANVTGSSAVSLFNCDGITIAGNRVRVTNPSAINIIGGKNAMIDGNRISTSTDTSAAGDAAGGIRLLWQSATASAQGARVHNNRIEGFVKGILDDCGGDNTSHAWIKNNQVNVIRYRGTYGSGYYGIIEENRSASDPNTNTVTSSM
jgi:parallel beta-helix repeat protein